MHTNKKKIPDLVVYDEEKGYYAKELTYGSNLGAPAINIEDVQGWKQNQANKANKQFKKRYDELKEEFKKLVDEVNWNELVYSAGYTFKPILGTVYHLYMRKDETMFLSLVDPNTWNQDYVGSFELDSREKWVKVEFFVK